MKNKTGLLKSSNKRFVIILLCASFLLFIPAAGMTFSTEIRWSFSDFIVAGLILFGTGALMEFFLRMFQSKKSRLISLISLFMFILLLWLELAVGIFDSPIAGS